MKGDSIYNMPITQKAFKKCCFSFAIILQTVNLWQSGLEVDGLVEEIFV